MHSAEQEIHAEIGEQHGDECEEQEYMEYYRLSQERDVAAMDCNSVDEQGYESPCLLRVPRPVCSPGDIRPHSTHEDAYGEQ